MMPPCTVWNVFPDEICVFPLLTVSDRSFKTTTTPSYAYLNRNFSLVVARDGSVGPVSRCREHFTEIP